MNAKRLFGDDDLLFEDETSSDRASHVEIRVDGDDGGSAERRGSHPARDLTLGEEDFNRVPRLALKPRELSHLPLDHREGFLLSTVDGVTSIETILDVCAMPAEEALGILESLVERGVLVIPR